MTWRAFADGPTFDGNEPFCFTYGDGVGTLISLS